MVVGLYLYRFVKFVFYWSNFRNANRNCFIFVRYFIVALPIQIEEWIMKISVVVITFNEEKNIARCLESVKNIADEIVAANIKILCNCILFLLIKISPVTKKIDVNEFKSALSAGREFTQPISPVRSAPILK